MRAQKKKSQAFFLFARASPLLDRGFSSLERGCCSCKTESPNENSVLDLAHARAFLACARPPSRLFNSTLAPSRFFVTGFCIHQSCAETCLSVHLKTHNTSSSCRTRRNGSHTPRSVFNAFIASKFSRRQACGRMVVSTAKVCLCISATNQRSHAMNITIEMGFFHL